MGLVQRVSGRKIRGGKLIKGPVAVRRICTGGTAARKRREKIVLCCV